MSDIFISYARSTEGQAKQIAEALRGLGYGVWRDDEIPANRAYADVIAERLNAARAVVVIWSADAARSQWVFSEANRAREDGKLVQLTVDNGRLPMPFDSIQCADLTGWSGGDDSQGWKQVVGAIASLASPSGAHSEAPRKAARKLSICVLPFANMSGDPEQEYFSDGISEDIITDLSKVSALSVVARNTAFTFKSRNVKVPDVARELSVSHVLEGSVRKSGGRVRITAQLIDGAAGDHLWAERYDRDLTDIFALQDEISQAIVAALKLRLLPAEKKAIEQRGTSNPDAYNLYLMARRHYVGGNQGDRRRDDAMVELCRRATDIDPNYAQAWALMSLAQAWLYCSHGAPAQDSLDAAGRALRIDPNLADAHVVRAKVLCEQGLTDEAFAEVDTAIRLDPESFEVNETAADVYYRNRRFADAVRYYEKAATLGEADYGSPGMLMSCYGYLGDRVNERRVAQVTLSRVEKALERDQSSGGALGFGGAALAALGEAERARTWIHRALRIDPDNLHMRYNFACALGNRLKDREGALELLGPFFAKAPSAFLTATKSDPDLDLLREDPRFVAMLAAAEARLATAKPADGAAA